MCKSHMYFYIYKLNSCIYKLLNTLYTYTCMYKYIHIYVYMCIYIYMHIHTCIRIYTPLLIFLSLHISFSLYIFFSSYIFFFFILLHIYSSIFIHILYIFGNFEGVANKMNSKILKICIYLLISAHIWCKVCI